MGSRRVRAVVPPFRALDPELAAAERLLASGHRQLSAVTDPLPDEHAAAQRLNDVLAGTGATPRLVQDGGAWRVVHVGTSGEPGELVAAAWGLAGLVVAGGWRRIKRCGACDLVFCDRTAGCTRRWCAEHRPRGGRGRGAVH
ncbi:hypothetical protein B0I33_102655 [Prauserella shujinwangii]|uniref:CGNR zinc finger protein n=1 Tax=Prauserella shujinwangii TaxID=1453103 RepID=A0A2T0M1Q0_9PSEU|nr:CGNR zinc finger domain-containing protein [Prauserella shujinwangii]PRX50532.1 hypothetical protein B0I33_102655 [Prauserella shujinwangii]